jgi:toxin-antitoxin system PIN domain toxin
VSYSLDVNILLYASDRSSSRHQEALQFLKARAADPDLLCLAWPTLLSYLRIATHSRIFAEPLSPNEALLNIESLTGLSRAHVICEEENFLSVYREVTRGFTARGNLVPDAHLAALLRQHDIRTLYTTDADFRKFEFLDVRNPFV